ncbi:DUF3168 domain-containing protein [Priestia megaterium]|uniref:DUF3168 domain-containing protein n=1 Tax=Priestia megaterium TaxID=1404 RepID=UPI003CC62A8B
MKTSLLTLQQQIYTRLVNYQPLMDKITEVFDYVPLLKEGEESAIIAPYVVIGNPTVIDWGSKQSQDGEQVSFTLHAWSEFKGKEEVYEILNLIIDALEEPLSLDSGFFVYHKKREFIDVITDPDEFYHGIIRFRFYVTL